MKHTWYPNNTIFSDRMKTPALRLKFTLASLWVNDTISTAEIQQQDSRKLAHLLVHYE
jgi:hypothetical protein